MKILFQIIKYRNTKININDEEFEKLYLKK